MSKQYPRIADLDMGFRERYLTYAELTSQLQAWAGAYPDIVQLKSIGKTPAGRSLWLLTIGPDPERTRPAVWVDANMHAMEFCGVNVSLAIAEAAIGLHLQPDTASESSESGGHKPPGNQPYLNSQAVTELRDVLFYIMPCISPDGAEDVLQRGGVTRSVPRQSNGERPEPHWETRDLDGDGRCRFLRMEDEAGDFVASPRHPGLMLPRLLDDPKPWYRLYPEGEIRHWDGHTIPTPAMMAGSTDLNRNFSWNWKPEPEQAGAGMHPGSEPESRAIMEFAGRHPNLYAWLNLHTFGGVFIRPLGHSPDSRMNQSDLALFRQLAEWATADTGYVTVSGFEEFTYEPDKPLFGDLTDYAYHQRGCLAQVCELWDLFARMDIPRQKPFVHHYAVSSRDDLERLADWDTRENKGRVFKAWKPLQHAQLGAVEVGGHDPLIGLLNPPPEELASICNGVVRYWLRVARLLPRLVLEELMVSHLESGLMEVKLTVANHGYLSTQGLESSRDLSWNTPLYADLTTRDCRLPYPDQSHQQVGHLAGWGRGKESGGDLPWYQQSPGNQHRRTLHWLVRGEGMVTVRVGNARVGWVEQSVSVG